MLVMNYVYACSPCLGGNADHPSQHRMYDNTLQLIVKGTAAVNNVTRHFYNEYLCLPGFFFLLLQIIELKSELGSLMPVVPCCRSIVLERELAGPASSQQNVVWIVQ
jgi:hypothetical protein